MSKTAVDPVESGCSCQVEIDGVLISRICYCPMHSLCGEMLSVLKSIDVKTVNSGALTGLNNILTRTARFEASAPKEIGPGSAAELNAAQLPNTEKGATP